MVEPTALDAQSLVLLRPDPVLDDACDLVAVPGDDPQARVELRGLIGSPEVSIGHLAMAPVIAEGLVLGLEDRAPLVLGDGTDLEALRHGDVRDLVEAGPEHQEEVADRLEPSRLEERAMAGLRVLAEGPHADGRARILA